MKAYTNVITRLLAIVLCLSVQTQTVHAQEKADPNRLIEQSVKTVSAFASAEEMQHFRDHLKNASAVLIFPESSKVGFIVGISTGFGAMMARDGSGGWNGPAFYTLAGGSVGFQGGAKVSEMIMLVMNEPALEKMLESKLKLGGSASVTIGVGGGAAANMRADVLVFSRSKGVFGGVSLEGGSTGPNKDANSSYYGQELSARDILIDGKGGADKAAELRSALDAATGN